MVLQFEAVNPKEDIGGVSADTNIIFDISNSGGTVSALATTVDVDGVLAWQNDTPQLGFSSSFRSVIADGYRYQICPDAYFSFPSAVEIDVHAENSSGVETLDKYYEFSTGLGPEQWHSLFVDHFDDGSVGITSSPGNGSISEPVGEEIIFFCPSAANCNWGGGSTEYAPVAYESVSPYQDDPVRAMRLEARMSRYNRSLNSYNQAGVMLWASRDNAYQLGYYEGNRINLSAIISDSVFGIANSGTVTDPNISHHVYRIYWNPGEEICCIGEDDRILEPGYVSFYWSDDYGQNFNHLHSRALDFDPTSIGLFARTWGTVETEVKFEYLELGEETASHTDLISDGVSLLISESGSEDSAQLLDAGGPLQHGTQLSAGQQVPGPVNQTPGSIGPFDQVGSEDSGQLIDTVGGVQYQSQLGTGKLVRTQEKGIEDSDGIYVSGAPTFPYDTNDAYGHAYFTTNHPHFSFIYDATAEGEYWNNPTENEFTGYGRDGYEYSSGVKLPGPVVSPWGSEAAGDHRSGRIAFPKLSLVAITDGELTIYDLDGYPPQMSVWMRFLIGNSSNFFMIGRVSTSVRTVLMRNGVLYVATAHNGIENGGLFAIDFKSSGQDFLTLIRSDTHWRGAFGKDVTDRNATGNFTTSGVSPSLRISQESIYSIDAYGVLDKTWVAVSGDDASPYVVEYNNQNVGQISHPPTFMYRNGINDDLDDDNQGNSRQVLIDYLGWLWFSINDTVFRNLGDYQQGVIPVGRGETWSGVQPAVIASIRLHHKSGSPTITCLAEAGGFIYAGTSVGVYQINKYTMESWLAYTISGGGGRGSLGTEGGGEVLAGTNPAISSISAFQQLNSGFIEISTNSTTISKEGSVTIVRNYDDLVVSSHEFTTLDGYNANPDGQSLREPGAAFSISIREGE